LWLYSLLGKARGVNLNRKSGDGVPKAVRTPLVPHWQLLLRSWCQAVSAPVVPLDPPTARRGGICCTGNSLSSISPCPGFVAPLERTLQRRRKMSAQHGKGQLPVLSSSDWRRKRAPGVPSVGGRGHRASLDSYRPPQAGQPPANKVLSRHGLPAPLGAWG
jgi:hypothetical protein